MSLNANKLTYLRVEGEGHSEVMRQNAFVCVLQPQWNVLAAPLAEGRPVRPFKCRKVIDWMSHGSFSWRNRHALVFSTLVFLTGSTFFSGNVLIGRFIRWRSGSCWIVTWFVGGRFLLGDMGAWGVDLNKGNEVIT